MPTAVLAAEAVRERGRLTPRRRVDERCVGGALVSAGDTPSTGGGTGTEQGFVADRYGTPIIGRTIEIQFTWRY